jgi:hypothetical protein
MTRIRQIRLRALASLPPSNNVFRLTLSDGHTDDESSNAARISERYPVSGRLRRCGD